MYFTKVNNNLLKENIVVNAIFNRFDIKYKNFEYDLYLLEDDFNKFYIPVFINKTNAELGVYLTQIPADLLQRFFDFLFANNKKLQSIEVIHTTTIIESLEPKDHWHIDLPANIEEFNKNLSTKTRYNTKWYPKKINEDLGGYKIEHFIGKKTPDEAIKQYLIFKNNTHNFTTNVKLNDYIATNFITDTYVLWIKNEIKAVLFLSNTDNNAFVENLTYDSSLSKYSIGTVLYYFVIKDLIIKKYNKIFLLGGNLDYKKRFNGINTTTYSGKVYSKKMTNLNIVEDIISHLPSFLQKIARRIISIFIFNKNNRKTFKENIKLKTSDDYIIKKAGAKFDYFETKQQANLPCNDYCQHAPSIFLIDDALKNIKINNKYNFMDIGSGAGLVLYKSAKKFKKVFGIEFEKRWVNIANDNLEKLKIGNYKIFNLDINDATSDIFDNVNVFYMYNPFQGQTMQNCLNKIAKSIENNNREAYIIYANAVCDDMIKDLNIFSIVKEIKYQDWSTKIYYHKKSE